jgi:hypothetical protein
MAVGARGHARATKDAGFLVDWPLQEGAKLAQSLTENHLPSTFHKSLADDPVVGVIRTDVRTPLSTGNCDILFPSKSWQVQTISRATRVDMGGLILPVAQADDLFLLKLVAGDPQDLLDAAQLFMLQSREEQNAWEVRAAKIGRSRAFTRCLKSLAPEE